VVPISARLAAVLAMATTDPAGEPFGAEAHVFGDAIGQPVGDIKRAWETCVLKAHGQTPKWTRNGAHARPREHQPDLDLPQRDSGRITGRHAAAGRLPLQSGCKREPARPGAS
jgi:hypothetical protein